jgi:hypothetical protein
MDQLFAQGDLLFVRAQVAEDGSFTWDGKTEQIAAEVKPAPNGRLIVGHSETGHHHFFEAGPNIAQLFGSSSPTVSLLRLKAPQVLRHDRPACPHPPIEITEPGDYAVIRQQERWPDGWRTTRD